MAISTETIRRITITADGSPSVDAMSASLDKLAKSQDKVAQAGKPLAEVTDKSAKKQIDATKAYEAQSRGLYANEAAQYRVAKAVAVATDYFNQGKMGDIHSAEAKAALATRIADINNKYGQASISAKAYAAATSGVSGQLIALSAGAGPVGTFLAALGPWGLAGAAGLGLIEKAISGMLNEANRMARFASDLHNVSQSAGLGTAALQSLQTASASAGVDVEKLTAALGRFGPAIEELRRGAGSLYSELLRIDPALVRQIQTTRDVEEAWNLVSEAYARADQAQQKLIEKAIAGRNAFGIGRVFGATADAGGISGLQSGIAQIDQLTRKQIENWEQINNKIEYASKTARNNFSSIFTPRMLEAEEKFATTLLEISRAAKELNETSIGNNFFSNIGDSIVAAMPGLQLMLKIYEIAGKYAPQPTQKLPELDPFGAFSVGGAYTGAKRSSEAISAESQARIAFLGSASSLEERRRANIDALNAAVAKNADLEQYRGRAIAGINLDADNQRINARVSILGLMASQIDIATQAQNRINRANLDGANISREQAALIRDAAVLQAEGAKQNAAAQFGLVSEMEILNQKNREYINITKQLGLEQTAAGYALVARNARAAWEAGVVAASIHPQLTRLSLDTLDLNKQFDTFAVGGVNNLTTALADISMGTKQTGDAFRSLGLTVVRALQEMIIKMMIFRALSPFMGGGGGFNIFSLFGGGGGGGFFGPEGIAKGAAFDRGQKIHPFAFGGIASDILVKPTLFPMANGMGLAGEAGPEAIMPLRRGADGRLGVASQGGGGSFTFAPVYQIDARGSNMSEEQFMAILAKNNKQLAKDIDRSLPDRFAAINRDPRRRG